MYLKLTVFFSFLFFFSSLFLFSSITNLKNNRYWALKNSWSMDGLPALHVAQKTRVQEQIQPLKKMVGPLAPSHYQNSNRFSLEHLLLVAFVTAVITAFVTAYGLDATHAIATRFPSDTRRLINVPLRTII